MLSPMAEHIQTTRMRRLPTVFGVFTTFSDEILDVKRFAQVNWLKSLTLEGKCLRRRAKPAHLGGHLPHITALWPAGGDCRPGHPGEQAPPALCDFARPRGAPTR